MSELCVDVRGLTRRFGDFVAVDNVDFEIRAGRIFGFLGPNGAGKSTTIRMLLGIVRPSEGQGRVLGYDILKESAQIRARVGYMAQKFSLYEDLTPSENLDFFAGLSGLEGAAWHKRRDLVVEMVKLGDYLTEMTGSLPGGVRQRLALAVTLLHEPELIFLDEPTGNVDPALRRYFWELIVQLSEAGTTVMVTSHYMDEVERCDKICFIHSGKLIGEGSPRELKSNTIKKELLSLSTSRRAEAMQVLKGIKGVENPFPAGTSIRFLFDGNRTELEELLKRERFSSEELEQARPNLKDVFIYLSKEGVA